MKTRFHRARENKIKFGSCCNITYLEYPGETCSKSRDQGDRVTRCNVIVERNRFESKGKKDFFFRVHKLDYLQKPSISMHGNCGNGGSEIEEVNSRTSTLESSFFVFFYFVIFFFFSKTSKRKTNYFFHSFSSATITIAFPVRLSVKISHLSYFCELET